MDDRLKTARKRLADVRGRLTVIDAALDDLRLERARLEDLVLEAESELNELEPFGGTGHPELSDLLEADDDRPEAVKRFRAAMRSIGLACAGRVTTSRQRMVAIDMTRGDADGLKKTLAGIRTLSEHYGSTYMTFAVVDHSGGIDDAQIRVRHDLMDAVLLADGGMQRTRNLEEMLSYIQDRYGSRVDNRLEATGEAEPEIAAGMHP